MPEYQVKIVDAFTTRRYAGNSCGVVTRAEGLTDTEMQAIARELNASETAFVFPSAVADFRVRFFTPLKPIPLAGHPTIATMYTLADEGRIDLSRGVARVTQELTIGTLPVEVSRDGGGNIRVVMTQAKPEFLRVIDRGAVALALGIAEADLIEDVPVQVVSTGTAQAMVPVRSIEVLKKLRPDLRRLGELEASGEFFGAHIFAPEAFDAGNRTHARHFAASAGIPEDPVTGSASGGMAAYLWKYGLVRDPKYTAEQGHIMGRPGHVDIEVDADGDEPTEVRIAGTAVTVLTGTITV
ncbi:MAG: PhzF family phenazine biosynthesis isomerase [Dehalococcoidia bacterium]|nr:PhzF family phenazine biosynthesis isomerase [Dehalococcoidia bacterium]